MSAVPESNVLDFIARNFMQAEIPYLLVGGVALNAYGYARFTDDVDLLMDERFSEKARAILRGHGYSEQHHGSLFSRMIPENPALQIVDLMYTDTATFQKMSAAGQAVGEGRTTQRIPSAEHLMAMKIHALRHGRESRRSKDAQDVIELARLQKIDLRTESFRELCLKFGDTEVYSYLMNLIRPL
jgi:hypothetical protein